MARKSNQPSGQNERAILALFDAIEAGDDGAVAACIRQDPRAVHAPAPNTIHHYWAERPIHVAARLGHTGIIERLIRAGADPNCPNSFSFGEISDYPESGVPLLLAIAHGHETIAQRLLDAGANPNAPPIESGPSPMDLAMQPGRGTLMNRMVIAGARPGRSSPDQNLTPAAR